MADVGAKGLIGGIIGLSLLTAMCSGEASETAPTQTPQAAAPEAASPLKSEAAPEPEPAKVSKREATAAVETTRPSASEIEAAEDTVKLVINMNGHLCADVIDLRQTGPSEAAVQCVLYRSGAGRAIYLVDAERRTVTER